MISLIHRCFQSILHCRITILPGQRKWSKHQLCKGSLRCPSLSRSKKEPQTDAWPALKLSSGHGNEDGFCSNKDWLRLMDHHSQEKPWSDDRITWFGGGNINRLLSCCKMNVSALEVSERKIECLHHIDLHYSVPIMKCQEFLKVMRFYMLFTPPFPPAKTLSSLLLVERWGRQMPRVVHEAKLTAMGAANEAKA